MFEHAKNAKHEKHAKHAKHARESAHKGLIKLNFLLADSLAS